MPRKQIDLRNLPGWLQYSLVFATILVVVLVAWLSQRNTPLPAWASWITNHVTTLGWIYIIALLALLVLWFVRKGRKKG